MEGYRITAQILLCIMISKTFPHLCELLNYEVSKAKQVSIELGNTRKVE